MKYLDVVLASGIDQISAKFLKDHAPVIDIHLDVVINLLIKLDTIFQNPRIKIKPLNKKRI